MTTEYKPPAKLTSARLATLAAAHRMCEQHDKVLSCAWNEVQGDDGGGTMNRRDYEEHQRMKGDVGTTVVNVPPGEIVPRLERLLSMWDNLSPLALYREFELIHPFIDGNGRTGKFLGMSPNAALADALNRWVRHNPKVVKI